MKAKGKCVCRAHLKTLFKQYTVFVYDETNPLEYPECTYVNNS